MQVGIHERRRREPALCLDDPRGVRVEPRPDPDEPAALDPHVDDLLADAYVANEEVHRVTVNRWRSLRTDRWTPS
jgi:hypothetical protein